MVSIKHTLPGAIVASGMAILVWLGASKIGIPVMAAAIIAGLLLSKTYAFDPLKPGIDFCAKPVLYIGVALLGLKIDFMAIAGVGAVGAFISIMCLILTFAFGLAASKSAGIERRMAALMSGAVAVCGVSAAAAISCVIPDYDRRNRDLMVTIAGITGISTLAMLVYPVLANWLGLSDFEAGTFFGATIHNVSQVVGAGYMISEPAGDFAAFVKLVRVSALLPIIIVIGFMFRGEQPGAKNKLSTYFPPFLVAFFVLAMLNTLVDIPPVVADFTATLSYFCLVVSLVAIGMKTKFSDVIEVGTKPFLVMAGISIFMIIVALILIKIIGV